MSHFEPADTQTQQPRLRRIVKSGIGISEIIDQFSSNRSIYENQIASSLRSKPTASVLFSMKV
jgi:hypothetical protein